MRFDFDWNPDKERINIRKHGLSFRQAASVFRDPDHLSMFDEHHSEAEDRWITIGIDDTGILRIVVHTFEQKNEDLWQIRIISARKANLDETKKYNEMTT
ncbi:MAG: BrnT family toxin [Anaerolineales bacterium]